MLAPVAAAARAAADRVSEGAHVRRPDPSRGSARTLARKWLERRCSAVGKSAGRVSPREGRAEKERLSGLRGERIYSFHCSLIAFLVGNIGMSESSVRLRPMGADIFLCTTICPLASRVCAKLLQLCLTLCDPVDGSSLRSSVHARILEWVAMPFSRRSS